MKRVYDVEMSKFKEIYPPTFLYSSLTKLQISECAYQLTEVQKQMLVICAPRIIGLNGYFLSSIPKAAIKRISNLESLKFEYMGRGYDKAHFDTLMKNNSRNIKNVFITHLNCFIFKPSCDECTFIQLSSLTLHCELQSIARSEDQWPYIVKFIDKCPNLQELHLPGIVIGAKMPTPNGKVKHLTVECSIYTNAVYVVNLMMSYRHSIEMLTIFMLDDSTAFYRDWFLPNVKHVTLKYPVGHGPTKIQQRCSIAPHFQKEVEIKEMSLDRCYRKGLTPGCFPHSAIRPPPQFYGKRKGCS